MYRKFGSLYSIALEDHLNNHVQMLNYEYVDANMDLGLFLSELQNVKVMTRKLKCKFGEYMKLRKCKICFSTSLMFWAFGQDHVKSA
jgi:hypothetical protein